MNIYTSINDITEPEASEGQVYIYAIENYPQGNVKIGRTTNPKQRIRSLSGSNSGGNIIKRIAISPETYLFYLEKLCHTRYNRKRIKGTEYFKITFDEAVEYIDSLFHQEDYEFVNNFRKEMYETNPKRMPNFLKKSN